MCNATGPCPFCDSGPSIPALAVGELRNAIIAHDDDCPLLDDNLAAMVHDALDAGVRVDNSLYEMQVPWNAPTRRRAR